MKNLMRILAALALIIIIAPLFVFFVSERELAVVLRLGKPVREYTSPGMHFRLPLAESVMRLPKTIQYWGGIDAAHVNDVNTNDNKKIDLVPWAIWRIKRPIAFVQRLRTLDAAEQRVAQISRSAMRDVIGQYDLTELVRTSDRDLPSVNDSLLAAIGSNPSQSLVGQMDAAEPQRAAKVKFGRAKLMELIRTETQKRLAETAEGGEADSHAIEVVDVGISKLSFVESVRQRTFDRWISEREAISMLILKEGEQQKAKILNAARSEVEKLEGLGQKEASEIRGRADAEVIRKFAEIINQSGDFYTFARTLEAYERSFEPGTRLILTTDSSFLRMLKALDSPDAPKLESQLHDTTSHQP